MNDWDMWWLQPLEQGRGVKSERVEGRGPAQLRAALIQLHDRGYRQATYADRSRPDTVLHTLYLTKSAHLLNRFVRWARREAK